MSHGRAAALLLIALSLSACRTEPPDPIRSAVFVVQKPVTLQIVPGTDGTLPNADGELDAFLHRWRDAGRGPLEVGGLTFPAELRSRIMANLTARVRELGGGPGPVVQTGDAAGSGLLLLRFQDFAAVPPSCNRQGGGVEVTWPQENAGHFGCATRANLGSVVAYPADLVDPKVTESGNAARGAKVIDAYRTRRPAGAAQGEGTSGMKPTGIR